VITQKQLLIETPGRGITDISREVRQLLDGGQIGGGLCRIFIHHTSASLLIMENADPQVLGDLERFMTRLVPDGDPIFRHTDEGPDDMPSHVRSALTHTDLCVPIRDGRLDLGTWQGIFLWEHRTQPHRRRLTVTFDS
jgi:secondary thiamine-phosphate synthase enzyme